MAGLIDGSMGKTTQTGIPGGGGSMTNANVTGYDPEKRSIDAAKETVSGQLDSLLAKDSPLSQRAMAGATQQSNSRGLVNSSMAAQAGQAALIDSAMPIATADANIYGTASRDNQAAGNTALQFNAGSQNQASQFNAGQANSLTSIGLQGEQTRKTQEQGIGLQGEQTRQTQAQAGDIQARMAELQGQIQTGLVGKQGEQTRMTAAQQAAAAQELTRLQGQIQSQQIQEQGAQTRQTQAQGIEGQKALAQQAGEIQTALQTLKGNQAADLTNIEASYKQLIQASAAASGFYSNAMTMIGTVMSNTDTTPEQKQKAVDSINTMLKGGLSVIGGIGNIDINNLVTFNPPP